MKPFQLFLVAGALFGLAPQALAEPVIIRTLGSIGTAEVGDGQVSTHNSARIFLLVTLPDGTPVEGLITNRPGIGNSIIDVPNWSFRTIQIGFGGCSLGVNHARWNDPGVYTIGFAPETCDWGPGDYIISIRLDDPDYQGAGIAKVTVE